MDKLFSLFAVVGLTACTTVHTNRPPTEEEVRVIASMNTCYELSVEYRPTVDKIRYITDYEQIGIPVPLIPAYNEQQGIVRSVPLNCEMWLSNPDYIEHITVLFR